MFTYVPWYILDTLFLSHDISITHLLFTFSKINVIIMFQVTIGVWLSVYIISACHRDGGDVCILSKNNKIQKPRVTTWCWVHLIHITIWHLYFCPFHRFTYSICYHLMKKTKNTKNTKKPYKIFWRKKRYLLYPRFTVLFFILFFCFIHFYFPWTSTGCVSRVQKV